MSVDLDSIFEHREPVRKPGWQKALPWVSGAILVAGVIAFVVVKYANTGHSLELPVSNQPAVDVSKVPKTIKLAPGAERTARTFIKTAVARKDLDVAYDLSGPQLRQGLTRKEWLTGNIPVIPYPVDAIDYAPMKIDFSYKREAQIEVALLPKQGSKARPALFILGLIKDKQGKWLVNSWVPRMSPSVPNGSMNNAG